MDRFHLYILAMDAQTRDILNNLNLQYATILYYEELMNADMKAALQGRVGPSFFWTFTPVVIEHIIKAKHEKWCTYIDADCYFLKDPGKVFDFIEDGDYSIGVIEHRYRRDEDHERWVQLDGRFNVAFNTFRDDANSLQILKDWRKQCLDCCTNKPTGENFGDQLYLNEWPDKYEGIYIVENEGIDVAPWNVNNYTVVLKDASFFVNGDSGSYELYMYHFHAISFLSKNLISLNLWNPKSRRESRDLFKLYRKYISDYRRCEEEIGDICKDENENSAGFVAKLEMLFIKFRERRESSIIGIIRNILIM